LRKKGRRELTSPADDLSTAADRGAVREKGKNTGQSALS